MIIQPKNLLTVVRLQAAILAVCPITEIDQAPDTGTYSFTYSPSATQQQKDAATAVLASFDFSDAATQTWIDQQHQNRTSLINAVTNAIQTNNTFINLASPTQAQAIAQVKVLSQQMNKVIQFLAELVQNGNT